MEDKPRIENVVIIGGGPAGLSAGIYTSRAGFSPLLFSGALPGGQLMLTSEIENFPGAHEGMLGSELIERMNKQAVRFGTRIINKNVNKVNFKTYPFEITVEGGISYRSSSVIIATGAKAVWLGLPSEKKLIGKGVSACAICDGFFFRGKTVAVIGGGDTALGDALIMTKFAKKVYLIHRRNSFRASNIMQEKVKKNPAIEIVWNAVVEEIIGQSKVEGIRLRIRETELRELKLDGVFVAIGHQPDTGIFKEQIELDKRGHIIVSYHAAALAENWLENHMLKNKTLTVDQYQKSTIKRFDLNYQYMTSVKGVFAAGDCVDHQYRQAATAAGTGVAAALEVERWLEKKV